MKRLKRLRGIDSHGYVLVLMPDHPRATIGGYIHEHIIVAERASGLMIKAPHVIHHVNEIRSDNTTRGNLVICEDDTYHKFLHVRLRALKACGHVDWKKCKHCKHWSPMNILRTYNSGNRKHRDTFHPICYAMLQAQRHRERRLRVKALKQRVAS